MWAGPRARSTNTCNRWSLRRCDASRPSRRRAPPPSPRSRYDDPARRQSASPAPRAARQGPRGVRGRPGRPAARRERSRERVRRGAARARGAQGGGAHPAQRVLVRAARVRHAEPLHLGRRGCDRGAGPGPRAVPRSPDGPRYVGAADHSGPVRMHRSRIYHRLGVGRVPAVGNVGRRVAARGPRGERAARPADLLPGHQGRAGARRERDLHPRGEGGGTLRGGRGGGEVRQAAAARLPGGSEAGGEVGRPRTAAAAGRGGSAGDEGAVSGGVPTDHWEDLGDCVTVRFAPEGWPFIIPGWALVFLGAWVAQGSPWLWVPEVALVLLAVWLLVFFRDPVRMGPRGEQFVIAPADGKVVDIALVEEPAYLAAQATRISIFMSVFDVHVNRYPATGAVELVRYHRGKFLHAASDKASLDNEQSSVGLRSVGGPVLVRQIAGLIARRIVTDGKPGDRVHQGERLGMIRFGSRVDVFLPLAARAAVRVAVGERVRAGATLLAEYGP